MKKIKLSTMVLFLIFSSCSIRTKEKYDQTKLSKIIDLQIKETIDNELIDDYIQLKNTMNQLEKKNNQLQKLCDSLFLLNSKPKEQNLDLKTYLFFSSSNHIANQESIKDFRIKLLSLTDSTKIQKSKFYLTGYSDASGDSIFNISLAQKRALHVKNILINEFCIPSSSITFTSIPNVLSCSNSLYRCVKIYVDMNLD